MKIYQGLYYSLTIFLFLLGKTTGIKEFFFLAFVLAGILLCSFLLMIWTLSTFKFVQEISSGKALCGETIHLNIRIHNDKPFPLTLMKVETGKIVGGDKDIKEFSLTSHDSIAFKVPVLCKYSGVFKVGMERIIVQDVFGFFRIPFKLDYLPYYRKQEVCILPQIVSLSHLHSLQKDGKQFDSKSYPLLSGNEAASLRKYEKGDPLKRVHWKASGKSSDLLMKQYEQAAETNIAIVLHNQCEPECSSSESALAAADKSRSAALSLILHCVQKKYHALFCTTAGTYQKVLNIKDFEALYESSANISFNSNPNDIQLHKIDEYQIIYFIFSAVSEQFQRVLDYYQQRNYLIRCVFTGSDESFHNLPADLKSNPLTIKIANINELDWRLRDIS